MIFGLLLPGEHLIALGRKCHWAVQMGDSFLIRSLDIKVFTYQMAIEIFPKAQHTKRMDSQGKTNDVLL